MFKPNLMLRSLRSGPISRIMTRPRSPIFKRFQSSIKTEPNPSGKKPTGMKALMKEYGYSALGVYLLLTAVDLPICYVVVHSMGQEEIQRLENKVKQFFGFGKSDEELSKMQEINKIQEDVDQSNDQKKPEDQSMLSYISSQFSWTEFAIAYGIHKSLIFIRLPITAAITPGIVKILRNWGFKIGTDKLATTATLAKNTVKDITASSPKFGTKATKKRKWFSWFF